MFDYNSFLYKHDKCNLVASLLSKLQTLKTASGAVVLAVGGGKQTTRTIVDCTFAATDTTLAITHGIVTDPLSISMSANTVGSVNPTSLVWTRTSASVITISKDSLTNSAVLLRVEMALPSTIS
jgi:hypothetical protein